MHPARSREQAFGDARPAHRRGQGGVRGPGAGADAVVESDATGRPRPPGRGLRALRQVNPSLVFITISGYGMTGPYKDMPSHGVAYDTWAGLVVPGIDDRGSPTSPSTRPWASAGPLFGARHLAGIIRPGDRRGLPHGDRPGGRSRRWTVPQRDVEGVRTPGQRGHGNAADNYERRVSGTAGMRHGVRYQIYASKDGFVLLQASEREFWRNFCAGVGRDDLFDGGPRPRRRTTRQPRAENQGHLSRRPRGSLVTPQHPIAREHRRRWPTTPSSSTACPRGPRRSSCPALSS
jgi:crotonobetainyl-CoA:carnitine CoA-transferase CaiB-like acyl-CoA transferase